MKTFMVSTKILYYLSSIEGTQEVLTFVASKSNWGVDNTENKMVTAKQQI